MSSRIVMHVDMDAFYASVELRRRPELRGTAVIVGGSPRGVVLSATYEARAHGVRSGMSSTEARRLAPRATFLAPDFDSYTAVSKAIVAVFRSVAAVVESASIDEAFLDLTGAVRMFGNPAQIGEYVRAVVSDEQQITCSVGIGPTKFVAKVASRAAKPDGLIEVSPDQVARFLHPMPVEAMWGVGNATARETASPWHLHRRRARQHSTDDLASGLRAARERHAAASSPGGGTGARVTPLEPEHSVGSQETFGHDTDNPDIVRRELLRMADRTARRMRKQRMLGRTITISVRFADFTELTRSSTMPTPTDVTDEIYAQALQLYERLDLGRARIRRVGVRVEQLVDRHRAYRQPQLTDPERGWREADLAIDAAVGKFGPAAVQRAVLTRRV